MSTHGAARRGAAGPADGEMLELAAFCGLPSCRREYRRVLGAGQRQIYCSDTCRRTAQREVRRLRTRLSHFVEVVEQTRIDLAAHGKGDDPNEIAIIDTHQRAKEGLARAAGVLRFVGESEDPLAEELRVLYEAVEPFVTQS